MKWTPETIAGIAYLAPVATVGSIWYILLFVAITPGSGHVQALRELLVDDPQRHIFRGLILLPVLCAALAAGYLSPWARTRGAAIALNATGIVLALAAWRWLDASIAAIVTLPLASSVPGALWRAARHSWNA